MAKKKTEKKAEKKPAKKAAPAKKADAPKQDATEALKERRQARRRARNARESGVGQTLDPKTGKPTQTAKQATKARRERVKKTREKARAADKAVAKSDYEGATDKERAKIDRTRERAVKRAQARNEKNRPPRPGEQTRPGEEVGKRPTRKEAVAQRKKYRERRDRLNERQARIDRRQGMNPAEGGTGWNWRWDRDPNTTKENPTGPPQPAVDDTGWLIAEGFLLTMGFTPAQITSLKTQLWGPDSDLRLIADSPGFNEVLISRLYDTPEFKERFPAVAESRAKNPQDFISVDQVLAYENSWEQIMPPETWGMFPKRETITQLMLGGVSLQELQSRVQTATWAAATAPAAVRQQLADRYGISVDALVGFYLDPAKGEEWLQSQTMTAAARAAGIGAGLGLTWEQSQHIIEQGGLTETADYAAIASGFAKAGGLRSLQEGYGQTATAEQIANSALLDEAGASTVVARTLEGKRGRFNRQAGVAETREGVVGLRTSSST